MSYSRYLYNGTFGRRAPKMRMPSSLITGMPIILSVILTVIFSGCLGVEETNGKLDAMQKDTDRVATQLEIDQSAIRSMKTSAKTLADNTETYKDEISSLKTSAKQMSDQLAADQKHIESMDTSMREMTVAANSLS